ncbi:MAG: type III secretion system export apparatus subunit SctT [Desulfobacteraceae bacterium]|jgi:type III secretion protein T
MLFEQVEYTLTDVSIGVMRIAAAIAVIPFFGRTIVPVSVKMGIILTLAIIIYPLVASGTNYSGSVGGYITILVKEAFIGFLFGYLISLVFMAVRSSGELIDQQRGAFNAQMPEGLLGGQQTTPYGKFLFHITTVLFFVSGGFLEILNGLMESYRVWPVLTFFPEFNEEFVLFFLEQVDSMVLLAALIAAPSLITTFTVEISLGFVNRFSPQFNVFMIAMSIKSGVVAFVFLIYCGFLLPYLQTRFLDSNTLISFIKTAIQ